LLLPAADSRAGFWVAALLLDASGAIPAASAASASARCSACGRDTSRARIAAFGVSFTIPALPARPVPLTPLPRLARLPSAVTIMATAVTVAAVTVTAVAAGAARRGHQRKMPQSPTWTRKSDMRGLSGILKERISTCGWCGD
jgi:hypothetical protein